MFRNGWGEDVVVEEAESGSDEGVDTLDFSAVTSDITVLVKPDGSLLISDSNGNTVNAAHVENLIGGSGTNSLDYSLYSSRVIVDLSSGEATELYEVSGFTTVIGSPYEDTIRGDDQANILRGGAGDDILSGNGGADMIFGGTGEDVIVETRNADFTLSDLALVIASETDVLVSIESAVLTGGASANTIDASAFTVGGVTLDGQAGGDILIGTAYDDLFTGGAGRDSFYGEGGTDTIVESRDADFVLTDTSLAIGVEAIDLLSSIEQADFTGGSFDADSTL